MDIMQHIPVGKENAVHLETLAQQLNISTEKVKNEIRNARQSGAGICSGTCGYWQSDDAAELAQFIDTMIKSSNTRIETIKNMYRGDANKG